MYMYVYNTGNNLRTQIVITHMNLLWSSLEGFVELSSPVPVMLYSDWYHSQQHTRQAVLQSPLAPVNSCPIVE